MTVPSSGPAGLALGAASAAEWSDASRADGPASVRILLPPGWSRIDLDPRTRTSALAELVSRTPTHSGAIGADTGDGEPEQAQLRRHTTTAALRTVVRALYSGGALYAAVLATRPAQAALAVHVLDIDNAEIVTTADLGGALGTGAAAASCDTVPIGLGPATRSVSLAESPLGPAADTVAVLLVQYAVGFDAGKIVVLSFATPSLPAADRLLPVFASIAAQARWLPAA